MSLRGAVAQNPEGVTHWDVRIALNAAVRNSIRSTRLVSHLVSPLILSALRVPQYPYMTQKEFKTFTGRSYVREMLDLAFDGSDELKARMLVRESDLWFNVDR